MVTAPKALGRLRFPRPVLHVGRFENVLGTSMEVQIRCRTESQCLEIESAVLSEIDRLESVFSVYNANSELRRWLRTHGEAAPVSVDLGSVLSASEMWRQSTAGAFNPGVQAFIEHWRKAEQTGLAPPESVLADIALQLRSPLFHVEMVEGTARRISDLPINLNAIAKGRIIDAACITAMTLGATSALVNIGGDVRHLGRRPVSVEIADPFSPYENAPPIQTIRIQNQGVATSGDYRRGFQVSDRWYSHLIDPRTGTPVENVHSATVVAPTSLQADVLSTAFSVLGPKESLRLCSHFENVALFLVASDGSTASNSLWAAVSA